jgi:hypothetical protein
MMRDMWRGIRMIASRYVTNKGLKGIMVEVQMVEFTGNRVEHAKNIPTSLLAGESGRSNNSSTL